MGIICIVVPLDSTVMYDSFCSLFPDSCTTKIVYIRKNRQPLTNTNSPVERKIVCNEKMLFHSMTNGIVSSDHSVG